MKRHFMKRASLICIIIIAIFAAALFAACSSGTETGADASGADPTAAGGAETQPPKDPGDYDDLGAFNFGGYEFTLYSPDPNGMGWVWCTLASEESDGTTINDAIYTCCLNVESRFNIEITERYYDWTASVAVLNNLVMSGDDTYDIMTMVDRDAVTAGQKGLLLSVKELPYINLSKNYWGKGLQNYITIKRNTYFTFADYNLSSYEFTGLMLFNKRIAGEFQIDDFYDLVEAKQWTFSKLKEYAVVATADLDGDGVMTPGKDRYGYGSEYNQSALPCFWVAAGLTSVEKDADDVPSFRLSSNQKFFELFERVFDMTYDAGTYCPLGSIDGANAFKTGTVFIFTDKVGDLKNLRDMDDDFGLIPHPLYDENQEKYYTRIEGANLTVVPVNNKDAERASVILEGWASTARQILIPDYYTVLLESKYTRDEQSVGMLTIIFDNRVYDLGDTFWCNQIRDGFLAGLFSKNNRDLASALASREKSVNADIAKTVALFDSAG